MVNKSALYFYIWTGEKADVILIEDVLHLQPPSGGRRDHDCDVPAGKGFPAPRPRGRRPRGRRLRLAVKYRGVRLRTAEERLDVVSMVVTVSTGFEWQTIEDLFKHRVELDGSLPGLIDVKRVACGLSRNMAHVVAMVEPTNRGLFTPVHVAEICPLEVPQGYTLLRNWGDVSVLL